MAEIAAGVIAAEQVVMTGVEAGAAYTVARPIQPLKGTLSQVTAPVGDTAASKIDLARSHHTVTCIGNRAFIFGGELSSGQLCNTDVHAISLPSTDSTTRPEDGVAAVSDAQKYSRYPAFPLKDAHTGDTLTPAPRTRHAAAARGDYLIIHGGLGASGSATSAAADTVEDPATIWLWDSGSLKWARIHATVQVGSSFAPRWDHAVFVDEEQDILIMHGGRTDNGVSAETWLYDFNTLTWTELPAAPVASVTSNIAYSEGTLYTISANDTELGGSVQWLRLGRSAQDREKPLSWATSEFPASPLTPGPRVRTGGALLPVSTGFGRRFLVYLFGSKEKTAAAAAAETGSLQGLRRAMPQPLLAEHDQPLCSDVWSLQLPSEGISGAAIKDAIRDKLLPGADSGVLTWSEIDVLPSEKAGHEGKAHPGPLAFFGAAPCPDAKSLFLWGGVSADKLAQGDGWLLSVS